MPASPQEQQDTLNLDKLKNEIERKEWVKAHGYEIEEWWRKAGGGGIDPMVLLGDIDDPTVKRLWRLTNIFSDVVQGGFLQVYKEAGLSSGQELNTPDKVAAFWLPLMDKFGTAKNMNDWLTAAADEFPELGRGDPKKIEKPQGPGEYPRERDGDQGETEKPQGPGKYPRRRDGKPIRRKGPGLEASNAKLLVVAQQLMDMFGDIDNYANYASIRSIWTEQGMDTSTLTMDIAKNILETWQTPGNYGKWLNAEDIAGVFNTDLTDYRSFGFTTLNQQDLQRKIFEEGTGSVQQMFEEFKKRKENIFKPVTSGSAIDETKGANPNLGAWWRQ